MTFRFGDGRGIKSLQVCHDSNLPLWKEYAHENIMLWKATCHCYSQEVVSKNLISVLIFKNTRFQYQSRPDCN